MTYHALTRKVSHDDLAWDFGTQTYQVFPYEHYRWCRENDPVHKVTLPNGNVVYMITKYEDIKAAALDHKRFSAAVHGGQWLKGKSIDGTMPLGLWLTLRDDIELANVTLECELNGAVMQHASASEMAFGVAELISELSFGMTLRPGDVLLTGTPSGIGNARTPPVFLKEHDLVVVRATGLGELRNRLVAKDLSS